MRFTALLVAALNMLPISASHAAKSTLHMREGGTTLPPKGFRDFCQRLPQECAARATRPAIVTLTPKRLQQLEDIQRDVNAAVSYASDQATYGESEHWAYPQGQGDCEDIALAKRKRLLDLGWPASALLFGIGKLPTGQFHLVLIAVTNRGDLVLDSIHPGIRHWLDLPMSWVMRQTATDATHWRTIKAPRLPRVRRERVVVAPATMAGR